MRDESSEYKRKMKEEKWKKVEPKVETSVFLACSANIIVPLVKRGLNPSSIGMTMEMEYTYCFFSFSMKLHPPFSNVPKAFF